MAFDADIGTQFEFAPGGLGEQPTFLFGSPHRPEVDPAIGQGLRAQADFPKVCGDPARLTAGTVPPA